ncbi:hypothetical protein JCM21900_003617 [Sporobolomyces salmonicolor]
MFQRVSYLPRSPASLVSTSSDSSASPPPRPPSQLGTLLFHGPVPPTTGLWYGIEWDDPSRGKHDGVHAPSGTRYFQTRVKGAGSFLRPDAPGLETDGKSFKRAFGSRYLEEDLDLRLPSRAPSTESAARPRRDGEAETTSEFYATESNFQVEVVLSNRVARRFKQLGRLREVGLEGAEVSRAWDAEDPRGGQAELEELGAQLSRLEVLNLSYSMLPTLAEAGRIASALPRLTRLILNSNRFEPVSWPTPLPGFERVTTLQLNNTLLSWPEILLVAPSLANLVELQIGFNRIHTLSSSPPSAHEARLYLKESPPLPKLELLNLESNELSNWSELVNELSVLPSLTTLILASNRFSSLVLLPPPSPSLVPAAPPPALTTLRHLSLTSNLVSSWSDSIEALAASCETSFPALSSLRLAGNPLTGASDRARDNEPSLAPLEAPSTGDDRTVLHTRLLTLARMPSLLELEGTVVSPAERDDAERFWIGKFAQGEEDERGLSGWTRARIAQLRAKHTDLVPAPNGSDSKTVRSTSQRSTLKDRLIRLRVHLDPSLPSPAPSQLLELSVLPTLRTLLLRSQIARLVGKPLPKGKWSLVALLRPAEGQAEGEDARRVRVEIPAAEEGREVGWWGLGEGDTVAVEASR